MKQIEQIEERGDGRKEKNETKRNEKGKGKGTDTKKIRNSVKKEEVV